MGYPLKILSLSIATYSLERVIRIAKVVSKDVMAKRGITGGSGFATAEMRVILIRVSDKACKLYPMVVPTVFVDDLAAGVTARAKQMVQQLGGFIETVAEFVGGTGQELSKIKSLVTATITKIGEELCSRWKGKDIHITSRK